METNVETIQLSLHELYAPQILASTGHFLIVYKPPKMHSAPGKGENLVEWCSSLVPEIRGLNNEGGLLHRLDYETQGLLLFARTRHSFERLLDDQKQGKIAKEYGAYVSRAQKKLNGFPVFSGTFPRERIDSYFRPFGPGRKEVRPVVFQAKGRPYRTEILEFDSSEGTESDDTLYLRLRIYQGFRHQIRCHLSWAGFPVLNDPVYGGQKMGQGVLALRAEGIQFADPGSGKTLTYVLPPLSKAF